MSGQELLTGKPWIGVRCEDEGADIWWPCKDHPSDEPDSMSLHFTVPHPLTCVSNGKFRGSSQNGDEQLLLIGLFQLQLTITMLLFILLSIR